MNWHNIYSYRVEFGHPAFISETDNNETSYKLALDVLLKAIKGMTEILGFGPPAELTSRYIEVYKKTPLWACRDARSNLHGGNYYSIYVKSEAEKKVLAEILKEITGQTCD